MQRHHVTSLCTESNLLWMEQRALRFKEGGVGGWGGGVCNFTRYRGEEGKRGAMGLLMYSTLTFIESNLKTDAFIQTETDGITHTHTHDHSVQIYTKMWERTLFSGTYVPHPHLDKCVYVPTPSGEMRETYSAKQICTLTRKYNTIIQDVSLQMQHCLSGWCPDRVTIDLTMLKKAFRNEANDPCSSYCVLSFSD